MASATADDDENAMMLSVSSVSVSVKSMGDFLFFHSVFVSRAHPKSFKTSQICLLFAATLSGDYYA